MEKTAANLAEYFKGVKAEWGKITWPDRKQVIVQTIIAGAVVFVFTVLIYGIDIVFKGLIDMLCLGAKHAGLLH